MRPMWDRPGDTTSIRVKGADVVVIDGLARRFCFPLGGPESPCFVVKYLHSGAKNQAPYWVWVVTDARGHSFFEGSENEWVGGDFPRLADAARLHLEPDAIHRADDAPPKRADFVDFDPLRMPFWIWFLLSWITFPLLVLFGWVGLVEGFPWFWTLAWAVLGAYSIWRRTSQDATVERNRATLPADERPADPPKKANVARRAWIFTGIAVVPALIAYSL